MSNPSERSSKRHPRTLERGSNATSAGRRQSKVNKRRYASGITPARRYVNKIKRARLEGQACSEREAWIEEIRAEALQRGLLGTKREQQRSPKKREAQ